MGNNIKSNTTFWTEINNYKIQVPYYQRDYAQGRTDGGRIDNIREVFVEELYQAIRGKKTCHLGLVFGSFDIDNSTFIAVDGQQRLTTVFLLHWYVAWRENKLDDYHNLSTNFSWDTRSYSSQFVELLFKIKRKGKVVDDIKANCNYFSIWENDPTVKGMLTMLEEIENQYPEGDGGLCQKLFSDDCKIRYDILMLEKNSDGKTYLKMNSRGRSLTTFELFKSKFIDEYKPSFANKFDDKWLNFMLIMSKDDNRKFADPDISYMNFINEYTYMILSLHSSDDSDKEYKHFIDAKMKDNFTDVPFISFEKYKGAFNKTDVIKSFEKFFDWICDNYETIKCIDGELRFPDSIFFADEIIKSFNPHFSHRTKLFSIYKYAELSKYANIDKELYKRWNRVFRNLVANSEIDGNNFGKICKTINQIANSDIYLFLANGENLNTFDNGQIEEEIAKARQIVTGGSVWESKIIEAEKYSFFKGAIRFLFTKENVGDDWGNFDTKWNNATKYFDENGVKEKTPYKTNALLMKSLLANCDNFLGKIWWHFEFSNDAISWKRILISNNWKNAVDSIMREKVTNETIEKCVKSITEHIKNTVDGSEEMKNLSYIKNIIDDGLMDYVCNKMSGAWIRGTYWNNWCDRYNYHAIWKSGYPASQIVLNPILSKLQFEGKISYRNTDGRDYTIPNCRYYKCIEKNVDFKYEFNKGKYYFFNWKGNPSQTILDVYLTENNWVDYKKRLNTTTDKGTDEDTYYCFCVTKEMEKDTSLFTKELDRLIREAFPNTDDNQTNK